MKKRIIKWRFWQKVPSLSMGDNFPALVRGRKDVTLHEPFSATGLGLTSLIAGWMTTGGAVATLTTTAWVAAIGNTMMFMTLGTGLSMASSFMGSAASKQKFGSSIRKGLQVNQGRAI